MVYCLPKVKGKKTGKVMPHLSRIRWVGEASASLSKGRLKSPLPCLSEGLQGKKKATRERVAFLATLRLEAVG